MTDNPVDGQGHALRIERAMLNSWPALATAFDGDWVIRLADGYTRRSNSVTCLGSDSGEIEQRIDRAEALFQRHGLPPVFRISPLAPAALNEALDRRGWGRFAESIVMTADLGGDAPLRDPDMSAQDAEVDIAMAPDGAWLESYARIDDLDASHAPTLALMLKRLVPDAAYGRLAVKGETAALALAVLDVELVGFFLVATAREHRRRGYSRLLLTQLLRLAWEHGCTTAWLAVEAGNEPAERLYRSLGFAEVYRYHYRSPG